MDQYELTPNPPQPSRQPRRTPKLPPRHTLSGTFWRGIISGVFAMIAIGALALGALLIGYAYFSRDLPKVVNNASIFETQASSFQSIRILDRDGIPINEAFDPNAGRRTEVSIDQIPQSLIDATIATEDANFLTHPGVDVIALGRAIYYAFQARDFVSGASTIPQQLAKMLFLSPEQTFSRKIREAILSVEMELELSKDEILELYLNEVYYGNLAYGISAAAETYFNKDDISQLTLAESALLAGLPQLPAVYDPYTAVREVYKGRQAVVLSLMVEQGFITPEEAETAFNEELRFVQPDYFDLQHPHFVVYVRQQLEELFDPSELYQRGLEVQTTLDKDLQEEAERIVAEQIGRLTANNAYNGALVSIEPQTGEVLAFVGSADFSSVEIDGQVNMALAPRQPGSSIKPLVYLSTFENRNVPVNERWTPGTLIPDIEEDFPDGINPAYRPTNYDEREHGLVTVRDALASSFNIPAVRALQEVGIPTFLELSQRLGITSLTRPDYGLSLSLGAGEVPLIEMTSAYATLANRGRLVTPITIRKITEQDGTILCEAGTDNPCTPVAANTGEQVISEVDAFLISDILSDNESRTSVFGPNSPLVLRNADGSFRPAAAKTGTTNDVRDVWTMGYTPDLVTGVWVGNTDNSPMNDLSGLAGAAPIWNNFMSTALAILQKPATGFAPPPGVRQWEVCSDTGTVPSEACPRKRNLWFAEDRPPLPREQDLYQLVRLDKTTGKLATEFTPPEAIEEKVFKVYPEPYRQWAIDHNLAQPPQDESEVFTFEPEVNIRQPLEGETVWGTIAVIGTANVPAFASYELQYGISHDPGAFSAPFVQSSAPLLGGVLGQWDVSGLGQGPHTLRLVVRDTVGNGFEQRVRVFVAEPTTTPPPSPTWTPPPTNTPLAEPTIAPTNVVPVNTPPATPTEVIDVAKPTLTPTPIVVPPTDTPAPIQRVTNTAVPAQPTATPPPVQQNTATPTAIVEQPTQPPTDVPTVAPTAVEITPVPENPTPVQPVDPAQPTPTWTPATGG